eukprot:8575964-Pyramimonas_sp.AAC.1
MQNAIRAAVLASACHGGSARGACDEPLRGARAAQARDQTCGEKCDPHDDVVWSTFVRPSRQAAVGSLSCLCPCCLGCGYARAGFAPACGSGRVCFRGHVNPRAAIRGPSLGLRGPGETSG